MTRYFLIMFLILSIISVNTLSSEPMKKGFAGCCLGTIGCIGIVLPGAYGWGNFYAEDYIGWLILNIGGSAFTVSSWIGIFSGIGDSNTESGGSPTLFIVGISGSIVFMVASVIWGTIATDRYNKRVWDANHRFTYDFTPKKDRVEIGINYRL